MTVKSGHLKKSSKMPSLCTQNTNTSSRASVLVWGMRKDTQEKKRNAVAPIKWPVILLSIGVESVLSSLAILDNAGEACPRFVAVTRRMMSAILIVQWVAISLTGSMKLPFFPEGNSWLKMTVLLSFIHSYNAGQDPYCWFQATYFRLVFYKDIVRVDRGRAYRLRRNFLVEPFTRHRENHGEKRSLEGLQFHGTGELGGIWSYRKKYWDWNLFYI